jgi:hypothetical protein
MKVTIYVIVCSWFSCLQLTQDRPRCWVPVKALINIFCRENSYHEFCFTICSLLYFIKCICWAIYWIYKNERCEEHKIRKYSNKQKWLATKKNTKANWINTYHELCFMMCIVLDFIKYIFSSLYWIYVKKPSDLTNWGQFTDQILWEICSVRLSLSSSQLYFLHLWNWAQRKIVLEVVKVYSATFISPII